MKRCVICERNTRSRRGRYLTYLYDKETDDYHCMDCDALVRQLVREDEEREQRRLTPYNARVGQLSAIHRHLKWEVETEEFYNSLDFSLDNLPED